MNSTYVTVAVMVLAAILPRFGINLGNDSLTTVVEGLIQIVGGLYVYFSHKSVVTAAKAAGVSF